MSAPVTTSQLTDDHCYMVSSSLPKFPTRDIDEEQMNASKANEIQMEYAKSLTNRGVEPLSYCCADGDGDVEPVYANVQEMEEESRRIEQPPTPDVTERPNRDLGNGWLEFLTETGRAYFFNPETGDSRWKPPRSMKPPSQVEATLNDGVTTISHYDNIGIRIPEIHAQEDDSMASCSAPVSPITQAKSLTDMVESVDSGIGRTSISVRNKCVDRLGENRISMQAVQRELAKRMEAFESNEELAAAEMAAHYAPGSNRLDDGCCYMDRVALMSRMPTARLPPKKQGTLNKCKLAEEGVRLKKKEWAPCYLFLSSAHIIFYKDERSAEKLGRHYGAPLGMCDLRGADLQWFKSEKDKRKKHDNIIQLTLSDGTVYLFSTSDSREINGWFHALGEVISQLPPPDTYPTPVLERMNVMGGGGVAITRSPSNLSAASPFGSAPLRHSSKKHKSSSKDVMSTSIIDDGRASASNVSAGETMPTRESIIEKLKRFFRSRPSMDSLKEKGIYKPEPVFGSTLQVICQHEDTTVPRFIQLVTKVIESKGLDTDGLYRVSGNLSAIQKIRCHVDHDKYDVLLREEDVHVLTGALKLFFRELSEPIFPTNLAKDFIHVNRLPNGENKIKAFDELLGRLPLVNRETLKVLFSHLLKVADHADKNRMEIHNLAIMFGPSLFSSGSEPNIGGGGGGDSNNYYSSGSKKSGTSKKKLAAEKKQKERPTVQSNSHLAFNMIMQGQTVEFLLKEFRRFPILQGPTV